MPKECKPKIDFVQAYFEDAFYKNEEKIIAACGPNALHIGINLNCPVGAEQPLPANGFFPADMLQKKIKRFNNSHLFDLTVVG